jgi:uncharacterized protein (DUF924 family)
MAKLALIKREEKRVKVAEKFAAKREALIATINNQSLSEEERFAARLQLQQLPRNASRYASVVAAPLPVVRVACSVNSVWVVTNSVKSP